MARKTFPMDELTLQQLPGEQWADMKGFKGIYQVSNLGRIRSIDRTVKKLNRWGQAIQASNPGMIRRQKLRISPITVSKKPHYDCNVSLWKNNMETNGRVARLVYEHFIGKITIGLFITHKDGDGRNNHYKNLVALDHSGIRKHAHALGRHPLMADMIPKWKIKSIRKKLSETSKVPVQLISQSGRVIKNFPSIAEAADDAPCSRSYLTHVLRGRKTHVKGKRYRYKPGFKLRR